MTRLQSSRKIILAIFMLSTFAIGMTEYVVTGLLTQFAEDFNVAVATTGLLLSVYAISVAIFGPLVRMLTIKFPPKHLLVALMTIFILSNTMAAFAPNFEVLLLSRLCSAFMHAPFFGIAMTMAVNISKPGKGPYAIAMVQGGLTIAVMLGVPFGSYLGGMFDWRYVFILIASLGLAALIGLILTTPNLKPATPPKLTDELHIFRNKNVLLVIAVIVFGFSGVFTVYTFIEPMLREFAGFGVLEITIGLFCLGVGGVAGNFASGKIPANLLTERLMLFLSLFAAVMILFTFVIQLSLLAYVMCFLFGAGAFGTTPILNSKIILAGTEAPALAGTIAASVFNLANSIGATFGTVLLNAGAGYRLITFIAAGMILFGTVLSLVTHKKEDKSLFAVTDS